MDEPQPNTESDGPQANQPPAGQPIVPAGPPVTPTAPAVSRGRRWRLVFALVAGVVAVLCLGGVGIAIALYDKATEIDRVSPDAVAAQFLTAKFVQRDDRRASLVACSGADLAQADSLLQETLRREKDLGVGISVNVENLIVVRQADETAQVTADVRRSATVDGVRQSLVDRLVMTVQQQDGWRVCDVTRIEQ